MAVAKGCELREEDLRNEDFSGNRHEVLSLQKRRWPQLYREARRTVKEKRLTIVRTIVVDSD
jgi:hypothetical protein